MATTISYNESAKGWSSFWRYIPDFFCKLNNNFYTIKNGQLHLHNDNNNPNRNSFYGVKYPSSIKTVISEAPDDDKIFKTLVLESDEPWSAVLTTNFTNGTIALDEFEQKDSRFFAFTRKTENSNDTSTDQGIGVITAISGLNITFTSIPSIISVNDVLWQIDGSTQEAVGTISAINTDTNTLTLISLVNSPTIGFYCFNKKPTRSESASLRGRYMTVELTNNSPADTELFAVNTNAVKSFV